MNLEVLMYRLTLALVLALSLACSGSPTDTDTGSASTKTTPEPPPTIVVEGTVWLCWDGPDDCHREHTFQPLDGVTLSIGGQPAQTTGPDGRFRFEKVPAAATISVTVHRAPSDVTDCDRNPEVVEASPGRFTIAVGCGVATFPVSTAYLNLDGERLRTWSGFIGQYGLLVNEWSCPGPSHAKVCLARGEDRVELELVLPETREDPALWARVAPHLRPIFWDADTYEVLDAYENEHYRATLSELNVEAGSYTVTLTAKDLSGCWKWADYYPHCRVELPLAVLHRERRLLPTRDGRDWFGREPVGLLFEHLP